MELKDRIKAPTPYWFRRIRRIGIIISAVGTALITASNTIPGFVLPAPVDVIAQWIVVSGITASAISTTAKIS